MSQLQTVPPSTDDCCLLRTNLGKTYRPQAEDILGDEHLLDLFRIVKQVLQKKRDPESLARLFFCVSYALGDEVKFYKPVHESKLIFDDRKLGVNTVRLPSASTCCGGGHSNNSTTGSAATPSSCSVTASVTPAAPPSAACGIPGSNNSTVADMAPQHKWPDTASLSSTSSSTGPGSPLARLLSVSYLTNNPPSSSSPASSHNSHSHPDKLSTDDTSTDPYTVRPYTNFRPSYPSTSDPTTTTAAASSSAASVTSISRQSEARYTPLHQHQQHPSNHPHSLDIAPLPADPSHQSNEYVMEPKQRGFYYQDGRISREPMLLQRYAEHGVLTQASLMRKRKRQNGDPPSSELMTPPPVPTKKPKIPHRHGEFEQRRDDIINRLRSITMTDLEQKAERLPAEYSLAIETVPPITAVPESLTPEQAAELLGPSLRILTNHSNMKPHLDNGMNQNGIYYNTDYFRLYLAFEQFQNTFAALFPNQVVKLPEWTSDGYVDMPGTGERDRDRDRNANMKAYRSWIEPLLTETNWAAFRRNIVVGERMMQLCKVVGQGVLLMTKELSGSKLHLTFTNNEWDEFITGLSSARWDQTIQWENNGHPSPPPSSPFAHKSVLVVELRQKFLTCYWFHEEGRIVDSETRRAAIMTHSTSSSSSTTSSST